VAKVQRFSRLFTTVLLPARWNIGWVPSMPESMTAIVMPLPSTREPDAVVRAASASPLRVAVWAELRFCCSGASPST
jgi:hypothetical protein